MKKYFVNSDVHGYYDEWVYSLNDAGFDINNNEHIVILLGDYFDTGPQIRECMNFIIHLLELNRIILIEGNHESMLKQAIKRNYFTHMDHINGVRDTAIELANCWDNIYDDQIIKYLKQNQNLQKIFKSMQYYFELDSYILVHGWIPSNTMTYNNLITKYTFNPQWRLSNRKQWEMAMWFQNFLVDRQINDYESKILVTGHCPSIFSNGTNEIYYGTHYYAIDGNVKISKKINTLVLIDSKED